MHTNVELKLTITCFFLINLFIIWSLKCHQFHKPQNDTFQFIITKDQHVVVAGCLSVVLMMNRLHTVFTVTASAHEQCFRPPTMGLFKVHAFENGRFFILHDGHVIFPITLFAGGRGAYLDTLAYAILYLNSVL